MIIRIADPLEDAFQLLQGAYDFISRMDFVDWFPETDEKFHESFGGTLMSDAVETVVAEHEGKIVGMIVMAYVPVLWNMDLLNAEELLWWGAKDAPKTAGLRLLKFVKNRAKEKGADMITFRKLTSSPPGVGTVYERMGLREIETTYTGLL